jgi:ABC-type branched-subunit amino acid transport system ATPase component
VSAPLFAARGLDKRFGAVVAADNVTVEIAAGEIVGIIGPNGAGKTTFVNMVTGYLKPDDGVILFRGADITRMPPREVTRLGIRRSFQVAQLFPNLSVRDNALVALVCAERTRPKSTTILRTSALAQANEILLASESRASPIDRRWNCHRANASCSTLRWRWWAAPLCCCSTSRPAASVRRRNCH